SLIPTYLHPHTSNAVAYPLHCILLLSFFFFTHVSHRHLHSFPTRRSSDLPTPAHAGLGDPRFSAIGCLFIDDQIERHVLRKKLRSEEHTSELQSLRHLVCRLLLEKKKYDTANNPHAPTMKRAYTLITPKYH